MPKYCRTENLWDHPCCRSLSCMCENMEENHRNDSHCDMLKCLWGEIGLFLRYLLATDLNSFYLTNVSMYKCLVSDTIATSYITLEITFWFLKTKPANYKLFC